MDSRSGKIYTHEELQRALAQGEVSDADMEFIKQLEHHPTPVQRIRRKVGRNDPCPCASGRKFKKCCLFSVKRSNA